MNTAQHATNLIVIEANLRSPQAMAAKLACSGKCGHFREQPHEPLAGQASFAAIADYFG
jgi:hypothetical protein